MTRVLVLHSADLLRSALEALLRTHGTLEVLPAQDHRRGAPAPEPPDVWVLDCECPDTADALETLSRGGVAAGRGAALIVLASEDRPGMLLRAFRAGALGYVNRGAPVPTLIEAIHQAAQGRRFVDTSLAADFLRASEMPLSTRELTVLSLAAEGGTAADIARRLCLSTGTVRNYLAAATRKMGARNRMDAIRKSQRLGWL
ncbi:LuxR C-terminal-related transcriptional regulator [Streptomyces sp. NPDC060194]|uniref:LuxR C-terminal-related transcriptional regulator n=1 Tax=Streptomyces sp. NPDC060194 TaxID=3347069 RepID=UPI00364C136A